MKTCCRCKEQKPFTEFHRRGNGYQAACKGCRKVIDREHYLKGPARHYSVRKERRDSLAAWVLSLKDGLPCTDCNTVYHFSAMQWDHVRGEKEFNVSEMPRLGCSREKILAEVEKCDLVCANCHAVRTYNRRFN